MRFRAVGWGRGLTLTLTAREMDDLRRARALLTSSGIAVRLTDLVGRPIEKGMKMLPSAAVETVNACVRAALSRALAVALSTMAQDERSSRDRLHKLATVATGAVGGFFGLAGLAVELPVTTVIMLRSIGDIARGEGHDLADPSVRVACLSVFALGGPGTQDDAAETGYYAVRTALGKTLSDAARHMAEKGMAAEGAPVIVRLIDRIAVRFGLVVQEKVALEAVPLVGAVSGSLINALFMDHFQGKARGHFIVRRLEAEHGIEVVRDAFERLGREDPGGGR
ncbi:MAG: EcsC family protein [Acidobacteriota bacterium]|nr:EcsC family protein [Acidobacteriota bacterium]